MEGIDVEYSDLPVPPTGAEGPQVPRLSPRQLVAVYPPNDWETFIHEWVHLRTGYVRLIRPSGPGDQGVDIAGLADDNGLKGVWDNYQCKHYKDPLVPSDVYPEVYKLLNGVSAGAYTLPRKYYFVAPLDCGVKLTGLLADPEKFRKCFVALFEDPPTWLASKDAVERDKVLALAKTTDFRVFSQVPVATVLFEHQAHPHHAARFQVALSSRTAPEDPPAAPSAMESRYVEQLIEVYAEHWHLPTPCTFGDVAGHDDAAAHLQRQRVAFYSAEALQRFARDEVPEGTFEALADQVHDGVISTHDSHFSSGFGRLNAVLTLASTLALGGNALLPRVEVKDRQGICHQLANSDRLTWMQS